MPDQLSLLDFETGPPPSDANAVVKPIGQSSVRNLFFAIFPQGEDAQRFAQTAAGLRDLFGLRGHCLQASRLHITLHKLGSFSDTVCHATLAAATAAAGTVSCPPMPIVFNRTVSFTRKKVPADNAFVLLCDAQSHVRVARLRQMLALALRRNGVRYAAASTPHMTMLYDRQIVQEQAIEPVCWNANRFALVLSHVGLGHHQWIAQWDLGG